MEKKFALLISFSLILLLVFILFKFFFLTGTGEPSAVSYEESPQANSEAGYIKLPSSSQGEARYSGKVVPSGSDSYELLDEEGKFIIVLTAEDAKLTLAEGRYVEVSGVMEKNGSGESVLNVHAITFK